MTTQIRLLPTFSKIHVFNNVNVVLMLDTNEKVKVEAGKNLINLVTTEVFDDTLIIRNDNKCNWMRSYQKPINVYVNARKFRYIDFEGTGKITCSDTLRGDTIGMRTMDSGDITLDLNYTKLVYAYSFGTGDMMLSGSSYDCGYTIVGSCYLYANNLKLQYCHMTTNTSGQSYINVKNTLKADIEGSGDVYYSGQPDSIIRFGSGKGELYSN